MARIKYNEAAGLEVKRGRPASGERPARIELRKLYVEEGRSIRDVAAVLGCSKDMVARTLKEYKIKARDRIKPSMIYQYPIDALKAKIREKGIRGAARDLGINESTLRYHLKRRKKS